MLSVMFDVAHAVRRPASLRRPCKEERVPRRHTMFSPPPWQCLPCCLQHCRVWYVVGEPLLAVSTNHPKCIVDVPTPPRHDDITFPGLTLHWSLATTSHPYRCNPSHCFQEYARVVCHFGCKQVSAHIDSAMVIFTGRVSPPDQSWPFRQRRTCQMLPL